MLNFRVKCLRNESCFCWTDGWIIRRVLIHRRNQVRYITSPTFSYVLCGLCEVNEKIFF